jgi:RNA polymerase primary sigma factor
MSKSESLNRYFKSIKNLNPLTSEKERELAIKIRQGCRASINTLVEHNLKIVVTIANKNEGRGILVDDLIQQGNIGLYEAALRFDPEAGVRFSSFARTRVLKMMNELIDHCGRLVRIPVNQEYNRYLAIKSGQEVDNLTPIRLDALISDDSKETWSSKFKFEEEDESDQENLDTLKSALNILTDREREVITLFFGLETGERITQIEIGEILGVTNVTVGNIKKRALEKIKQCYNY